VGACLDTAAAADAEIVDYRYMVIAGIHGVFDRTHGNTGVIVYTFLFVYVNYRRQSAG
jgi:ribosomal protein L35AE/L33A